MKQIFTILVALLATTNLWAQRFQYGELYYNITSSSEPYTVEVGGAESSITTVIIPETVTYEGTTFSVTSIGSHAFYDCSSLTSITIPNSVTSIGYGAFRDCTSLTSVTIPNSVTSIGDWAFGYCSNLTSVTIGNSVTSIGNSAFFYCSALTSISIPNSVTSIGEYAFFSCSALTSIVVESGNSTYDSRENCNAIIETATNTLVVGCKNTIIPNSVTSIGEMAFGGCRSLTSVTIPNSVTSIGDVAFFDCTSLTSITIPNSVTSIGDEAFGDCYNLTSITIPNSVMSIGYAAFGLCSSLTFVIIGNSVTSIGDEAFGGCNSLTSIVVESGNSTYDSRENCNAIIETATNTLIAGCQNTIIPNSVTSIGEMAFEGCYNLTSITIPNSVTSIGRKAFLLCSSLKTVICEAIEVPELGGDVFEDMPLSEATLYVPAQSLDDYKAAEQWKEFGTILPLNKTPSAVENTQLSIANGTKLLRNGLLYILKDGKTYTITGQEL